MAKRTNDEFAALVRSLGANRYDVLLPETKALRSVIDAGERLQGIVYGRYRQDRNGLVSRGALVATDRRVILLNKKPLLLEDDEITYRAISGVDLNWVWLGGTVSLHTRMGDIHIRTFNRRSARNFVDVIKFNLNQDNLGVV
jgi:hypothetical protein